MLTINQEQPKQAVNLSRSAGRHLSAGEWEHSSLEKTDMFTGGTSNDIMYVLHLCSISYLRVTKFLWKFVKIFHYNSRGFSKAAPLGKQWVPWKQKPGFGSITPLSWDASDEMMTLEGISFFPVCSKRNWAFPVEVTNHPMLRQTKKHPSKNKLTKLMKWLQYEKFRKILLKPCCVLCGGD